MENIIYKTSFPMGFSIVKMWDATILKGGDEHPFFYRTILVFTRVPAVWLIAVIAIYLLSIWANKSWPEGTHDDGKSVPDPEVTVLDVDGKRKKTLGNWLGNIP